ncbi:hypothetical protein AVEN_85916-1 [Araneus ventricosus]|uniref:Uncharacterized protein n=1 Tax=Araneus ventricosus TaxID=182803 RepID=A0A4Y2R897_ARAVE|nr:hypothetical protein AVEN_14205-1 [Araneus ventricosus]GBN71482.1 hypothetical protein AVEN_47535-1 [Araneus ventricosus]GBN71488.1 hypothetical protein AVEN_77457-1 [Araneus ventricosus]GBN71490.1 hypothetical protein AVEN_85916-1 [Araneus ventricosus]
MRPLHFVWNTGLQTPRQCTKPIKIRVDREKSWNFNRVRFSLGPVGRKTEIRYRLGGPSLSNKSESHKMREGKCSSESVWGNQSTHVFCKEGGGAEELGIGLALSAVGAVRHVNFPPTFMGSKWKRSAKKPSKWNGTDQS